MRMMVIAQSQGNHLEVNKTGITIAQMKLIMKREISAAKNTIRY